MAGCSLVQRQVQGDQQWYWQPEELFLIMLWLQCWICALNEGDQRRHWQRHELWTLDLRLWEQTAAVCWWTLGLEHEEKGSEVQRQGQIPQEHDHAVEEIPMEHCSSVRAFVAIYHSRKCCRTYWNCLSEEPLNKHSQLKLDKILGRCFGLKIFFVWFDIYFKGGADNNINIPLCNGRNQSTPKIALLSCWKTNTKLVHFDCWTLVETLLTMKPPSVMSCVIQSVSA